MAPGPDGGERAEGRGQWQVKATEEASSSPRMTAWRWRGFLAKRGRPMGLVSLGRRGTQAVDCRGRARYDASRIDPLSNEVARLAAINAWFGGHPREALGQFGQ